jgi:hypothetical protein
MKTFVFFLIEHSFKAFSLEDLVKSFDNTINACFSDQQVIESKEELVTPKEDLVATSKFVSLTLFQC